MIKSTLLSLPTFFMSLFLSPCRYCKSNYEVAKRFIMGCKEEELKSYLVNWPKFCSPMVENGWSIGGIFF